MNDSDVIDTLDSLSQAIAAGWVEMRENSDGTVLYKLTDRGWQVARQLREKYGM